MKYTLSIKITDGTVVNFEETERHCVYVYKCAECVPVNWMTDGDVQRVVKDGIN
jgi:hypothetical protein